MWLTKELQIYQIWLTDKLRYQKRQTKISIENGNQKGETRWTSEVIL